MRLGPSATSRRGRGTPVATRSPSVCARDGPASVAGTDTAPLAVAPVEPTRPRLLTPVGCAGFASCAYAPPTRMSSPTTTATVPLSFIDLLRQCRMHSPNASLDHGSRDARDELVEEEVVDDRDRYPDEQRARHERAPEVHVASDQLRRHAERHGLLLGDGDEGE